jgi:transcriptional regulator with XRE-family HTH domain
MIMNVVGPKVRLARKMRGYSQKDVAAKCNLLGWDVSRGTIAKIESRNRKVTDEEILCLSLALNVSISTFFVGAKLYNMTVSAYEKKKDI